MVFDGPQRDPQKSSNLSVVEASNNQAGNFFLALRQSSKQLCRRAISYGSQKDDGSADSFGTDEIDLNMMVFQRACAAHEFF